MINKNELSNVEKKPKKINTHVIRAKKAGVFFLLLFIGFFGMQIFQIGSWTLQSNLKWPYLYYIGDPQNSMGLSCGTPVDCKLILNYGENNEPFEFSVEESISTNLHFFNITNLNPDTIYYWKLNCSNSNLNYPFLDKIYSFRTGPIPTEKKPFKLSILGDTRPDIWGNTKHIYILKEALKEHPNFILNVGDMVMGPGITGHWDRWFYEVRECAQKGIPIEIGLGNHEWDEYQWIFGFEDKGKTYKHYMEYPEPENYYAFNYSNAAFISLDTNDGETTETQIEWLNKTLEMVNADENIDWIIVFGHYPLYSEGGRSSRIGNAFENSFNKYNVDMYISGHIHHYARVQVNDITYIISGGGGAELSRTINPTNPNTKKSAITFQYCTIEIDGSQLYFKCISHNGIIIDECQLTSRKG